MEESTWTLMKQRPAEHPGDCRGQLSTQEVVHAGNGRLFFLFWGDWQGLRARETGEVGTNLRSMERSGDHQG